MSFAEFQRSIAHDAAPPAAAGRALCALWHDARGEWDRAHHCAQQEAGPDGAWAHAYLHRKEGDRGNAAYWYACAGRPMPAESVALATEWAEIAREVLAR